MSDQRAVNEHYLDRLVEAAQTRRVEATEDILSGSGVKLVAKGSQIDARTRDRLLQHKLHRPLEACTRVTGGVASLPMDEVAGQLIKRHALLSSLCDAGRATAIETAFSELRLSSPLESLLTLYADQGPHKLEHAIGVSLVAAALMLEVAPAVPLASLLTAGLMHDIGELYIDPTMLARGSLITVDQWKHIAVHPVAAASLLAELPGGGPAVALPVLQHHERLDGFGYPSGLRQGQISLPGQVLALAEMLTGVIESGRNPAQHVAVMLKLMGAEFDRRLLDHVSRASKTCTSPEDAEEPAPADSLLPQAATLSDQLEALQRVHAQMTLTRPVRSPALDELLAKLLERHERLTQTLSSAGLNPGLAASIGDHLGPLSAPMRHEMSVVLRELQWRLRELHRQLLWRAERLEGAERERLRAVVAQILEPVLTPPARA